MRIEIRNDSVVLDGYVNVTGKDSKLIPSLHGKFIEQIKPGAFQRSLEKRSNVDLLLLNHDKSRKLGSTSDGNLELFEDGVGLRAICTVNDADVIEKAKNKQLRGWSFGFYSEKDSWKDEDGIQRRFVEDLDVFEVSIIDNTKSPAYVGTSIEMRDDKEIISENRNSESEIRVVDSSTKSEKREEVDYSKYEEEIKKLEK